MRQRRLQTLALLLIGLSSQVQAIEIYAHRGARAFNPENTMPAYRSTLSIGTDWVDMDVVLTKDGEVLISHDPILNPAIVRNPDGTFLKADQKIIVKDHTLAELKRFDVGRIDRASAYSKFFSDQVAVDGTKMPTLKEVIKYVNKRSKNKMAFQIEMKTDPTQPEASADPETFAKALYKILKEEGILSRSEIQAFDFKCLLALQKLDHQIKTAYLTSRDNEKGGVDDFMASDPVKAGIWTAGNLLKNFGGSIPKMIHSLGGYAWEPEDAVLTQATLAEAKSLGLKVVVWSWPEKLGTAFDPTLVQKMIDWKVDGIITDDPGRLTSMLTALGMPAPKRYPLF